MTERNLREEIAELNSNMRRAMNSKEGKKFKFPRSGKVSKSAVKKGYAGVCYINDNREVVFKKFPIVEGTVIAEGVPRLATADHALTFRGKPFYIIPSWSVEPFSPVKNFKEAVENKTTAAGFRLLLNRMKSEQVPQKKSIGGWWIWILVAVVVIGGAWYLYQKGAFRF